VLALVAGCSRCADKPATPPGPPVAATPPSAPKPGALPTPPQAPLAPPPVDWKPAKAQLAQSLACASAPKAAELNEAALIAAAEASPDAQYELLRGWICADPNAPLAQIEKLDAAHAEQIVCGLPWSAAYGANWIDFADKRLRCPACNAIAADAAPLCLYACAANWDETARAGGAPGIYKVSAAQVCGTRSVQVRKAFAVQAAGDARQAYDRLITALRALRKKGSLGDADYGRLADAFTRVHYAQGGEISTEEMWDVDLKKRAPDSALSGAAEVTDAEWARLLPAFGKGNVERPPTAMAVGEAKIVAICSETKKGENRLSRAQGIAWMTPTTLAWLEAPARATIDPEATGGCTGVLDAVDIDGDGAPEVILIEYGSDEYGLAVYAVDKDKAVKRWSGGGRGG
jgi:hypothetical protein